MGGIFDLCMRTGIMNFVPHRSSGSFRHSREAGPRGPDRPRGVQDGEEDLPAHVWSSGNTTGYAGIHACMGGPRWLLTSYWVTVCDSGQCWERGISCVFGWWGVLGDIHTKRTQVGFGYVPRNFNFSCGPCFNYRSASICCGQI